MTLRGPEDTLALLLLDHPAVPLEAADVAPDRHLRYAELARQLADVDRLLGGDALEDRVPPIRCADRVPDGRSNGIRHEHLPGSTSTVDE